MSLLYRALPALTLLLLAVPAQAGGICDAKQAEEDAAVYVTGKVTDSDPDSGSLVIRDDCGEIIVFVPGESDEEVAEAAGKCPAGSFAEVIGAILIGQVEASTVYCEPANN